METNDEQKYRFNPEEKMIFDNKEVLQIAKSRRAMKKGLNCQILDFIAIVICFFILINLRFADERALVAFIFCTIWGTRLAFRIFKFIKPTFKDGVAAYLKELEAQKLEAEYNKLNKISCEDLLSKFKE